MPTAAIAIASTGNAHDPAQKHIMTAPSRRTPPTTIKLVLPRPMAISRNHSAVSAAHSPSSQPRSTGSGDGAVRSV